MHIGPSESHFSKRRQIHLHIHCRCQNQIRQVHKNQIPFKQQCFAIRLLRLHLHLHFLSMQTSLLCTIRDKYISHSQFFSARNTCKVQVFYRNAYIWFPKVNLLTSPPWLVHRLFPKWCIPASGISSSIHTLPSFQAGIHRWLRAVHRSLVD